MLLCCFVILLISDQWMIERLREAMGLLWWLILLQISFSMKKKCLVEAQKFKSIKTFLTLWLVSGSTFSSKGQVAASSSCSRLGNTLFLCFPVWPAQAVQGHTPKSSGIDFAVKTFYCLLELTLGMIARWQGEAWTWAQTWSLPPDQLVVKVWSAQKSHNELCGVWILFKSVETSKIDDSGESISTLIHQTDTEQQAVSRPRLMTCLLADSAGESAQISENSTKILGIDWIIITAMNSNRFKPNFVARTVICKNSSARNQFQDYLWLG